LLKEFVFPFYSFVVQKPIDLLVFLVVVATIVIVVIVAIIVVNVGNVVDF
jgi:hypothetical protein